MNEQQIAIEIRRALDESADRLPYRVTQRLEAARRAALAKVPEDSSPARAAGPVRATPARAAGPVRATPARVPAPVPLWARVAMTAAPVLALVVGLSLIYLWNEKTVATETADIDAAMLVDDVPITAYLDRGFAVYVKNSEP